VLSLVHALQSGDYDRLREAVGDRWHQPARASLVPLLAEALAIEDAAVLGAFLSGAGPSIALLARHDLGRVERLLASMYERAGVTATVRTLAVHEGASVVAAGQETTGRTGAGASDLDQMADALASARGRTL